MSGAYLASRTRRRSHWRQYSSQSAQATATDCAASANPGQGQLRCQVPGARKFELLKALEQPVDTWGGEVFLTNEELNVFVSTYKKTGFAGGINWYRNIDRNWHCPVWGRRSSAAASRARRCWLTPPRSSPRYVGAARDGHLNSVVGRCIDQNPAQQDRTDGINAGR